MKYTLVITNYSPSTFLSFSSDAILLPVYEVSLKEQGANLTRVYFKVVSRRNSYLFNVSCFHYYSIPKVKLLLQQLLPCSSLLYLLDWNNIEKNSAVLDFHALPWCYLSSGVTTVHIALL